MRTLLGASILLLTSVAAWSFESGRASFSLRISDDVVPYEIFALYALPNEALSIEAVGPQDRQYELSGDGRTLGATDAAWSWQAPSTPGLYVVEVTGPLDRIVLNVFVLHPASAVVEGRLNGFRIDAYPETPLGGRAVYLPPDGFVELNEATASTRLSPHFTLSQFPSKQAGSLPKYLVLRERLLIKLEMLLEELNRLGIAAEGLTVMSGYRTPFYNRAIGNVPNSRHVFGGAADIFLDREPRDGQMDDINNDDVVDFRDAQRLYQIAHELFSAAEHRWLIGGLGVYRRNSAHGPFLHIDARGTRARWGLIP